MDLNELFIVRLDLRGCSARDAGASVFVNCDVCGWVFHYEEKEFGKYICPVCYDNILRAITKPIKDQSAGE